MQFMESSDCPEVQAASHECDETADREYSGTWGVAYVVIFTLAILIAIFCTLHEDQWIDRLICKIGTVPFMCAGFLAGSGTDTDLQRKSGMVSEQWRLWCQMADSIGNRIRHMVLRLWLWSWVICGITHIWYETNFWMRCGKIMYCLPGPRAFKRKILWKHCLKKRNAYHCKYYDGFSPSRNRWNSDSRGSIQLCRYWKSGSGICQISWL